MRRKVKRASEEEILAFEKSMHRQTEHDPDGESLQGGPCLYDFTWLDDTALATLPYHALLKAATQYRDIIMGLLEDRKELTGAFRTVLERNNILITDVFGRKSEKLAVLLGGSRPAGRQSRDEDSDNGGEINAGIEEPVKSSDCDADKTGEDRWEPEACAGTVGSGCGEGSGQDGDEEKKKKARTWKPVRTEGCLEKQCRDLPVIQKVIEMKDEELENIFGKGNYRRMESNDKEIIEYEYVPRVIFLFKKETCK